MSSAHKPELGQKQLTINIDVGHDIVIPVTINDKSGVLYDLHHDIEIKTPFQLMKYLTTSSRWSSVIDETSITFYVAFLSGKQLTIIDRGIMTACLLIYSLLDDKNFFNLLLEQLLQRWTLLSSVLYSVEDYQLPEEVKYDIFLLCPEMLLPKRYLNDKIFMESWTKLNTERMITLNNFEEFETNIREDISLAFDIELNTSERIVSYGQTKETFADRAFYVSENAVYKQFDTYEEVAERVTEVRHSNYKRYKGKEEGVRIVIQDKNGKESKTVTTFVRGLQEGPTTIYDNSIKRGIFREQYYIDGVLFDEKAYFKNGNLDTWFHMNQDRSYVRRAHYANGEEDYVIKTDIGGNKHAIKYLENGAYVEADQNAALFYDSNAHLVRKITSPFSRDVTMSEIEYNQAGQEISWTELPPKTIFDITLDREHYPFIYTRDY